MGRGFSDSCHIREGLGKSMITEIFAVAAHLLGTVCVGLAVLHFYDRGRARVLKIMAWIDSSCALLSLDISAAQLLLFEFLTCLFFLLLFVAGGGILCLIPVFAVILLPFVVLRQLKDLRARKLDSQIERTVSRLADALKSVGSLHEALGRVCEHSVSPVRDELEFTLKEIDLGIPVDDALEKFAARSGSRNAAVAVTALLVGRRTGGELAAILEDIASTFREQKRLEGILKTRTAEGRGQAWVLGSVPPFLLVFLYFSNPQWISPLLNTNTGWIILAVAGILEITAILVIRKLVSIDVT